MAKRGPKPKPLELKLLRGDHPERLNLQAPAAIPGAPEPPDYLDAGALAEWRAITAELAANGVLSRTDRAALALYCVTYSRWLRVLARLKKEGETVPTGAGSTKVNPLLTIATQAELALQRLLVEFGMTPSARNRVKQVEKAAGHKDDLSAFLEGQA